LRSKTIRRGIEIVPPDDRGDDRFDPDESMVFPGGRKDELMTNPRADYIPIVDRSPLKLPGDARVAVWVIVNIEEWMFDEPMARTVIPPPQGVTIVPDITNYGWFDYGQRVGFWRIREVLDRHGIRASVSLNASVCNTYPRIIDACLDSRWELFGHGFVQRALPKEQDERAVIRKTIEVIREKTGQKIRGWMGPGLHETFNTPDILAEEGIEYVLDWVNDDQPYPMKVKKGCLFSIPYTMELNDIPIYAVQHHRSAELFERSRDQFDTLYEEGRQTARIMAIAVHPYITGVPHRIGYFNKIFKYIQKHDHVIFMTGSEILDWYKGAAGYDGGISSKSEET
jgi:peptidoglycan/xylan/chitin deacetylase (PgdA/CDA1 family)